MKYTVFLELSTQSQGSCQKCVLALRYRRLSSTVLVPAELCELATCLLAMWTADAVTYHCRFCGTRASLRHSHLDDVQVPLDPLEGDPTALMQMTSHLEP